MESERKQAVDQRAERIYAAKRAGTVSRLETALGAEPAEAVTAGWEAEAARCGVARTSAAFWTGAEVCVAAALVGGPVPPECIFGMR